MKKYFICSSIGSGNFELTSFDNALLNSGISNYNLVKVSSILPVHMALKTSIDIPEGNVLYTAYASKTTNKKNEVVSAAIAVGIPNNPKNVGVIMEYSGICHKSEAEQYVKMMVVEAMNNRDYQIKEIVCQASEVVCNGKNYVTAFAALSMWD
ncbi:MAG: arginine decarboxylase, pyruvoyl-dependent [Faecalibacterium sp.]|nr:arginine decarboxylase, pyruvoyl-dependent [Ruminococcus flavefaciens]MCM1391698.1 arginine decarboxylase, pyruvoyl-dependent [Ruminococcus sp.]MCM1484650.1 arginine decarboxylase, pyruvoyl-dependent [Faecalibacterium sp.]